MSNTTPADYPVKRRRAAALVIAVSLGFAAALSHTAPNAQESQGMTHTQTTSPSATEILTARQQAIVPIAAFAATGDMSRLGRALNQGLDAGLTVSDAKEILVQLYAYAGFPRSLNALGELMKVLDARKRRGIEDAKGAAHRAAPSQRVGRCWLRARATRPSCRAVRSRGRSSTSRRPSTNTSRPIYSAISSNATTSTGKVVNWPLWACCPRCQGQNRNCNLTSASA